MNPRAQEVVAEFKKLHAGTAYEAMMHPSRQSALMGELMLLLAEEQEKASVRMEQQTDRLVKQTDRLVAFTKGLYWFTIALLALGVIQLIVTFCHP